MQRKTLDFTATRTSRTDRFAQMSKVEQVIEQKKREIQARLQKQEPTQTEKNETATKPSSVQKPKTTSNKEENNKPISKTNPVNIFSNDGSFLDQFKQLSETSKRSTTTQNNSKSDRSRNSDRVKSSRWSERDRDQHNYSYSSSRSKKSRFSDKSTRFEPELTQSEPSQFSTPQYTSEPIEPYKPLPTTPQLPQTNYPPPSISIPPPQIQLSNPMIVPPPNISSQPPPSICVGISSTANVSIPPPGLISGELTSIPTPNPIAIHTIPQPEPIDTISIPPPAPLQLQNIPPPSPIRLNEIPNPKPIDVHNIPAPNDTDIINANVIKNIPPPNKSIPPPNITTSPVKEKSLNIDITVPPPSSGVMTIPSVPPPPIGAVKTSVPPPIINMLPQTNITQFTNQMIIPTAPQGIPALMAQPVLPPVGMNVGAAPLMNQMPPAPVQMSLPPPNVVQQTAQSTVCATGLPDQEVMVSVARVVAQCGASFEEAVRQRSSQDPNMWFLFNTQSEAYRRYQELVTSFKRQIEAEKPKAVPEKQTEYRPEDLYEPDCAFRDEYVKKEPLDSEESDEPSEKKGFGFTSVKFEPAESIKTEKRIKSESDSDNDLSDPERARRRRKKKSRWGDKVAETCTPVLLKQELPMMIPGMLVPKTAPSLSKVKRTDPALIQYALNSFGTTNLTDEEWQKAEDHYKINLLYQDMLRKRQELDRLQKAGRFKYEYDSDEEVEGGTWEHKLRMQEMEATELWAEELTKKAEGKHHIGDFLPPDELKRFMEQSTAAKEGREPDLSDYKEFKLKSDNIGFQMLQKLGWSEGQGLGAEGSGIVEPVNKAAKRDLNQGLGANNTAGLSENDDEYDAYRKRMMLAYRFRPNPLNNPRRPYY